jgi:hypothetical protein
VRALTHSPVSRRHPTEDIDEMTNAVGIENEAPRFWADQGCKNIPRIPLAVDRLRAYTPHGYASLEALVHLADSLRSLQHSDWRFVSEPLARALLDESARLLETCALHVHHENIAQRLRRHAMHLRAGTCHEFAREQAEARPDGLIVLCGPLTTWRSKGEHYPHSAVVAVEDEDQSQAFARLDESLPELARYYQELLGVGPLRLAPGLARYTVADLALCGGEANATPKHFAYFLPEDGGVKSSPVNKTVVFRNVYAERLRQVSVPLFRAFQPRLDDAVAARAASPDVALRWFRAHDVAHSWRLGPGDGTGTTARLGSFRAGGLDEALSDVLGYLALAGPWRPRGDRDEEVGAVFFVGEMLRYASRWDSIHPDALAARVTLHYLMQHRYIEVSDGGAGLVVDPSELTAGCLAMARKLIRAVRGDDDAAVQELAGVLDAQGEDPRLEVLIAGASALNNDVRY